ncbi:MAG TPA: RNase H family protein, partial [Tepidisphaeraceae bacterium]|nr:RNase H family protein [Tepidisphaeraceae bacterium]
DRAVKEVLKTVHSRRQVRFNSDSQIAINGILAAQQGLTPTRMNSSQAGIVDRIVQLGKHYNFSFSWVKGHNNDALNEVADRLAVGARRCKEMALPAEVRQDMVDQIRESVHLPLAS